MRYGAICERNPVILKFVGKDERFKIRTKDKIKRKKLENNEFLVKVEFNLECGDIRKGIKDGKYRIRKNI